MVDKNVGVGEIFTLERPSQPSTGYVWGLSKLDNLVLLNENFTYEGAVHPGAGGSHAWTFQAIKEGSASLQFVQYRTFDVKEISSTIDISLTVSAGAENVLAGGWHSFSVPTNGETALLQDALKVLGVSYKPLLVSTQTLPQKHYLFIANAEKAVLNPEPYPVLIRLFASDPQKGQIEEIRRLGRPGATGARKAFVPFEEAEAEVKKALQDAFRGHTGLDFTPLAVSHQVVGGMKYLFAGNGKVVYPGAQERPLFVTVYVSATGDKQPRIASIKDIFKF